VKERSMENSKMRRFVWKVDGNEKKRMSGGGSSNSQMISKLVGLFKRRHLYLTDRILQAKASGDK
jgi:hypothetical protein